MAGIKKCKNNAAWIETATPHTLYGEGYHANHMALFQHCRAIFLACAICTPFYLFKSERRDVITDC